MLPSDSYEENEDSSIDTWGCGAVGSTSDWQSGGRGFDSRQLHFLSPSLLPIFSQGRMATLTARPSIIICSPSSKFSRGSRALIRGLAFTIPEASRDKAFSTVRGV